VHAAVGRALDLLGGPEEFISPGERILLKPNFLVASRPEAAVTTHPEVFRAVARHLAEAGASLSYGDSPGFGRAASVARRAGISEIADGLGIRLADFAQGEQVSFAEGKLIKQFIIANGVLDADGLVTLPKLKTHGLTRFTGAVKNQFGCIPGPLKGEFHARMPDQEHFAQMLVDLNRLLHPRLIVMDGILAMEGNGPRGGDPRRMNVLIVSGDPVAADTVACRLIDLDPGLVLTNRYGDEWGLGAMTDIEIVGDPVESFVTPDFVVNRRNGSTTGNQGRIARFMKDWVVPKPYIVSDRCTSCGTCVKVCPVDPKAVDFTADKEHPPVHDYSLCIRCYCCQEMCPEHAIEIATPMLGRFIHR